MFQFPFRPYFHIELAFQWNEIDSNVVRYDIKLPDDGGEIPKSQGRGWRFDSRLWNLLSTSQKLARWSIASCALPLACRPSVSKFFLNDSSVWEAKRLMGLQYTKMVSIGLIPQIISSKSESFLTSVPLIHLT